MAALMANLEANGLGPNARIIGRADRLAELWRERGLADTARELDAYGTHLVELQSGRVVGVIED
jgi:hypothetical protein